MNKVREKHMDDVICANERDGFFDIGTLIFLHVPKWSIWYSMILSCRTWYLASKDYKVFRRKYELTNFTRSLLNYYNSPLNESFVIKWSGSDLGKNPDITLADVKRYPKQKINRQSILNRGRRTLRDCGVPESFIDTPMGVFEDKEVARKIGWTEFCANKKIIPSTILTMYQEKHLVVRKYKNTIFRGLCKNPNLTIEDFDLIFEYLGNSYLLPDFISDVCANQNNITVDHILDRRGVAWSWAAIIQTRSKLKFYHVK
jgi:hypothetical protein